MPNVGFVRSEAAYMMPIWLMVRDAIEGETAIKGEYGMRAEYYNGLTVDRRNARKYLPQPNPTDRSSENDARYKAYVERAVWYNMTSRTRDGLVGQVFLRPPVSTIPKELSMLEDNADGDGLNLEQVSKRSVQSAISFGRGGLLTDYPPTNGATTVAEMKTNNIQPTIKQYWPWQIINWATIQRGAKHVLSLVVLKEINKVEVDEFQLEDAITYRVLRLDPTTWTYTVTIWSKTAPDKADHSPTQTYTPRDSNGKAFDEIPFQFTGSEANDVWPDRPPLYDLASINIAHYRNSADYEESCFMVGQPTPVITGVTEQWVENVLKGAVQLGSRGSISLPPNADAKLLQAEPNQMPLEAMKAKEEQALALGAKLVMNQKTVRTATEVMVDTTSESSTLHNVAKNVSAAMEKCLKWACRFVGADDSEIEYQLNTEFELTRMNANDRLAVVKLWQSGAIAFEEMRTVLKVDGTAYLDDKEAADQISKELAAAMTVGGAPIADPLQAKEPTSPENAPTPAKAPPIAPAPESKAA
jgi:hypothetical protein